ILDYFEASHDRIQQEKFFPKSFGLQLREKLILDYLDQGDTNLNFVRLIAKSKDSENIRFSDKTKLKARKIAKRINDEILDSGNTRSEEHTSELQSRENLVCRLLLEKKKNKKEKKYKTNIQD